MTRTRRVLALWLAAALAGGTIPFTARAEKTRFWRQSSFEDFDRGTAKGVALRSDGRLVLAPRFAPLADPNAAYLWSLRLDSKGRLYAAAGSNARVLRFDAACLSAPPAPPKTDAKPAKAAAEAMTDPCKPTTVFESTELSAQTIELDAQDNLYVGTSPDGKVYRVTPKGEKSVLLDPKTKYIWDLALDAAGAVYVATGDKGEVHVVRPDGKSELYYKSDETHARSLAFDAKGNLVVGTEPGGLIIRVEKSAAGAAGVATTRGFVLYETAKKEVTALLADLSGNIFAAAIGEKPRTLPGVTPQPVVPPPPPAAQAPPGQQPVPQQPTPFAPFPTTAGGSEIYRIRPDGAPEEVWSSREDLVYALGFSADGKLLVGTGNRGLLIRMEGNKVFSSLAKTATSQVTGIAAGADGRVFLCTANPGKLFALGPDDEPEGSFESQTFDAKIFSQWGRMLWWGENGATEGRVEMFVRTGNTSNPERSWSPWAGPYTEAQGSAAAVPAARFAQWKAVFRPAPAEAGRRGSHNLSIAWVGLAYLPRNVAPSVDHIVIQNAGVRVQGPPPGQPGQRETATIRMPAPAGGAAPAQPQVAPRFDPPPAGVLQRGARGVVWSATDANDDELEYAVYFRGEGEKAWKLLKDKLEYKFVSWDTGTMPDGAYYLKVVASDSGANPPGEGLSAERESDRFEVDNTPPVVEGLRAESTNPETRVRFEIKDNYSPVARVEWSLDAGEWKILFPRDRTTDAPQESYELSLRDLAAGEHTLAVRGFDQFENSASAKVTFVVAAARIR